jgi:hypothetical protein
MGERLADILGFGWDRTSIRNDVGVHRLERAVSRYRRALPEFVWDAAALEGNPFTYPEVQTLVKASPSEEGC